MPTTPKGTHPLAPVLAQTSQTRRQVELLEAILHRVDKTWIETERQTEVLQRMYAVLEAIAQRAYAQDRGGSGF